MAFFVFLDFVSQIPQTAEFSFANLPPMGFNHVGKGICQCLNLCISQVLTGNKDSFIKFHIFSLRLIAWLPNYSPHHYGQGIPKAYSFEIMVTIAVVMSINQGFI